MDYDKLKEEIERREYYNQMSPFPVYDTEIILDMKSLSERVKKQNYNNEPISYCKNCLSIRIKTVKFPETNEGENRDVDYCSLCSKTDLGEVHVSEWEDMYQERYGKMFLTEESNEESNKDKK